MLFPLVLLGILKMFLDQKREDLATKVPPLEEVETFLEQ